MSKQVSVGSSHCQVGGKTEALSHQLPAQKAGTGEGVYQQLGVNQGSGWLSIGP